jgi:hypothetical protein
MWRQEDAQVCAVWRNSILRKCLTGADAEIRTLN